MEIVEQTQGAILVLKPNGALSGEACSVALRDRVRALTKSALGRIVIELSEVAFVDSKGIESLLDSADSLSTVGITLRLCAVKETVRDVLRITGNEDYFEFHDDAQSAVRSFL